MVHAAKFILLQYNYLWFGNQQGHIKCSTEQGVYFIIVLWTDFLEESAQIGFSELLGSDEKDFSKVWI